MSMSMVVALRSVKHQHDGFFMIHDRAEQNQLQLPLELSRS
jgi:hypothetical protein